MILEIKEKKENPKLKVLG